MKYIQSTDDFDELIKENKPFCAIFTAKWCADCRAIDAALPEIEATYSGQYKFAMIDMDDFMDIAQKYDIMGIPSFIIFKNGQVLDTFISPYGKTRKQIISFLDKSIQEIEE